jgi:hypothetical protein
MKCLHYQGIPDLEIDKRKKAKMSEGSKRKYHLETFFKLMGFEAIKEW